VIAAEVDRMQREERGESVPDIRVSLGEYGMGLEAMEDEGRERGTRGKKKKVQTTSGGRRKGAVGAGMPPVPGYTKTGKKIGRPRKYPKEVEEVGGNLDFDGGEMVVEEDELAEEDVYDEEVSSSLLGAPTTSKITRK
jgi:hypothetical protein